MGTRFTAQVGKPGCPVDHLRNKLRVDLLRKERVFQVLARFHSPKRLEDILGNLGYLCTYGSLPKGSSA